MNIRHREQYVGTVLFLAELVRIADTTNRCVPLPAIFRSLNRSTGGLAPLGAAGSGLGSSIGCRIGQSCAQS